MVNFSLIKIPHATKQKRAEFLILSQQEQALSRLWKHITIINLMLMESI